MLIFKVVLLVSLAAIAVSAFTPAYVIAIRPMLSHSGTCTASVMTYGTGYTETGVCTYSDGSVCQFTAYHNNVTAGQHEYC